MKFGGKRFLLISALGLLVGFVVMGGPLVGLYYFGLFLTPERPSLATEVSPPLVTAALWARFGGEGPVQLKAMTPWSFVGLRLCLAKVNMNNPVAGREACLQHHPGLRAASAEALRHVEGQQYEGRSLKNDLQEVATTVWLTRHRSAEEVLSNLAVRSDFGYGWQGVSEAAKGYFGKEPGELTAAEAVLLAAALYDNEIGTNGVDPWCEPDSARNARNRVLIQMSDNGVLSSSSLLGLAESPLRIRERSCSE